jgi:hypothetical protein
VVDGVFAPLIYRFGRLVGVLWFVWILGLVWILGGFGTLGALGMRLWAMMW